MSDSLVEPIDIVAQNVFRLAGAFSTTWIGKSFYTFGQFTQKKNYIKKLFMKSLLFLITFFVLLIEFMKKVALDMDV